MTRVLINGNPQYAAEELVDMALESTWRIAAGEVLEVRVDVDGVLGETVREILTEHSNEGIDLVDWEGDPDETWTFGMAPIRQ